MKVKSKEVNFLSILNVLSSVCYAEGISSTEMHSCHNNENNETSQIINYVHFTRCYVCD